MFVSSDDNERRFLIDVDASQSAADAEQSQADTNSDVGLVQSHSESRCISDESDSNQRSLSGLQTAADTMQTAEDILDELDNDWVELTLIKLLIFLSTAEALTRQIGLIG